MRHLVAAILVIAACPCFGDDAPLFPLRLTKSLKELDKPAEFIYTNPSGKQSTQVWNAAATIDTAIMALSAPGLTTTSLNGTASIAKDTTASKPADTRAVTAGLRSLFALGDHTTLPVGVYASAEDDRIKHAHGWLYRGEIELICECLRWPSNSDKPEPVVVKVYPRIGYFSRTVHSGPDGVDGRFGGPYAYVYFNGRLGHVTPGMAWFTKLQLELTAQIAKDTASSGGFVKQTRRLYEGSLSYWFYDDSQSTSWKPSVAITRTSGEDPILNQPYKLQTAVSLRLSHGI